jgi:hypothetical protein
MSIGYPVDTSMTSILQRQHAKKQLTVRYYARYYSENTIFRKSPLVNSEDGFIFTGLFAPR